MIADDEDGTAEDGFIGSTGVIRGSYSVTWNNIGLNN